jgi:ferric iron reductase protein FhuF
MTTLTTDQLNQLNSYSIYVEPPAHFLFTLEDVCDSDKTKDILKAIQTISDSPNETVAASYFLRRYGMFIAMQFYNLASYDEVWSGEKKQISFGAIEEYGKLSVSTFMSVADWQDVDEANHSDVIRTILHEQCAPIIRQIRAVSSISPLTLWENIFGFMLWQYHVLLSNPATASEARIDLELLKDDSLWEGIAPRSLFATYLNGSEPSALLNTQVRKTCCFSKDVPGLMQCGFCPL